MWSTRARWWTPAKQRLLRHPRTPFARGPTLGVSQCLNVKNRKPTNLSQSVIATSSYYTPFCSSFSASDFFFPFPCHAIACMPRCSVAHTVVVVGVVYFPFPAPLGAYFVFFRVAWRGVWCGDDAFVIEEAK